MRDPASWLPLATRASSRNLALVFLLKPSVTIVSRKCRTSVLRKCNMTEKQSGYAQKLPTRLKLDHLQAFSWLRHSLQCKSDHNKKQRARGAIRKWKPRRARVTPGSLKSGCGVGKGWSDRSYIILPGMKICRGLVFMFRLVVAMRQSERG